MMELFASQQIYFPVICIQETWINDESKLPLMSLDGYNCYYVEPAANSHGGLITYVDNSFEVAVIKEIKYSTIWEGLFLELKHGSIKTNLLLGMHIIYQEIIIMQTI